MFFVGTKPYKKAIGMRVFKLKFKKLSISTQGI